MQRGVLRKEPYKFYPDDYTGLGLEDHVILIKIILEENFGKNKGKDYTKEDLYNWCINNLIVIRTYGCGNDDPLSKNEYEMAVEMYIEGE